MADPLDTQHTLNALREDDIQRYTQLREEIDEVIKKIDPSVTTLNETTNQFLAHFDVFQTLFQEAREQLNVSLKETSHNIADSTSQQFSQKIDSMVNDKIKTLDSSIQAAQKILNESMRVKHRKVIFFSCIGVILSLFIGFGLGHIYAKQSTYEFPRDIIKLSALAYRYEQALETMTPEERLKLAKLFPELPQAK